MGAEPLPKHVRYVKFFKTEKLVNSPGFSEVCMMGKHPRLFKLHPHMLIVLDPPMKANNDKFKPGTIVGTCQATSVKCEDERTKQKIFDLVEYPKSSTQVSTTLF